jgi:MFS family permease
MRFWPSRNVVAEAIPSIDVAAEKTKPGEGRRFYGWRLLGVAAVINGLGGSVHWQGFTVFFLPVSQGLNLSSAQTALPFALSRAEGGLVGPITGWMIDRFGVRPLMLIGTVITGIGYVLLSKTNTYLAFVLVYLFVVSLGSSTGFMQATTSALNTWFVRRRGTVMGLNSAAFRLGGAFIVPLLSVAVLRWGWETAAFYVGFGMILLIAPLALFFKRSPESIGQRPDGDPVLAKAEPLEKQDVPSETHVAASADADWTTHDAIRSRAFWVLATATVLRMSVHGAIFVHFVPLLVWKGENQQVAANLVGAMALCSVPVILIFGWLSDRTSRQVMLAVSYTSSAFALFLLTVVHGTWPVFGAMLFFIGSEAGSSLNWALVGDLFGRTRFATIRGLLAPMYNAALLVTPVAVGWIYDTTGSYRPSLLAGSVLMLMAAFTFLQLSKPERLNQEV